MTENELDPILLIVVTYNSADHIANCLDSITGISRQLKIIVFDNGSQDDSATIAEGHSCGPIVMRSKENLGFGRAVNMAAATGTFQYLLLLNPDAILHQGTVDALAEAVAQFPQCGIYGGKSLDLLGRSKPGSVLALPNLSQAAKFAACFGFLPFTSRWEPDALARGDARGVREVPAIEGSLLLISARVWHQLGGFDEAFFLYGEDVDLCMRARRFGYRVIFTDRAIYTHVRGASSPNKAESMTRMLLGRRMLYDRYAGGRWGVLLLSIGVIVRATFEPLVRSTDVWRHCWRQRSYWLGRD